MLKFIHCIRYTFWHLYTDSQAWNKIMQLTFWRNYHTTHRRAALRSEIHIMNLVFGIKALIPYQAGRLLASPPYEPRGQQWKVCEIVYSFLTAQNNFAPDILVTGNGVENFVCHSYKWTGKRLHQRSSDQWPFSKVGFCRHSVVTYVQAGGRLYPFHSYTCVHIQACDTEPLSIRHISI